MLCCANCFDHPWLKDNIRDHSTQEGDCQYCDSKSVQLIEAGELFPFFENLISIYSPLVAGKTIDDLEDPLHVGDPLLWLVQEDWQVFNDRNPENNSGRLLDEIVNSTWDDDSGESPISWNELYTRRVSLWHSSRAERWDDFCDEVKDKPDLKPTFDDILGEDLSRQEANLNAGTTIYRARPGWAPCDRNGNKQPWQGVDIGAPPPDKAKTGRANREGKVVLYASDQEATAVAEAKPARGFLVSVGEIRVRKNLHILDLGKPIESPNPFTTDQLSYWLEFIELLNSFAWALSKPLERADDISDYIPSQKLSEYIENQHFAGIRYPSAMAPAGTNLVLFDPTVVEILTSRLVEVTNVTVAYKNHHP
jgi:hypothetical protein